MVVLKLQSWIINIIIRPLTGDVGGLLEQKKLKSSKPVCLRPAPRCLASSCLSTLFHVVGSALVAASSANAFNGALHRGFAQAAWRGQTTPASTSWWWFQHPGDPQGSWSCSALLVVSVLQVRDADPLRRGFILQAYIAYYYVATYQLLGCPRSIVLLRLYGLFLEFVETLICVILARMSNKLVLT